VSIMRNDRDTVQLTLLVLALCSALAGCATHGRGSYVIAGMDYNGVESALSTKDGARIYIRDVERGAERDLLAVRYTHLDGDKREYTARISKEGITITPITATSTIEAEEPKPAGKDVLSAVKLPWVAHRYDTHPDTGRMLVGESRDFMPRSFEYDVATGARRQVGLVREWMFYLRRDFANSRPLSSFVRTKEPSPFQ
jgi:hypothetical protein